MIETTIVKQKHVKIFCCKVNIDNGIVLKNFDGIQELEDTIGNGNIIYDDDNKNSTETIMSTDIHHVADQKKKMYIILTEFPGISIKMNFIPAKHFSWMKNEEMDELRKHHYASKKQSHVKLESENALLKKELAEFKNKFDMLSSFDYINFCHNDVLVEDKKRMQDKIIELQILNDYLQSSEMQMKRKKCDEYLSSSYKKIKP